VSDCAPGLYVGRFAPSPTGPLHFGSLLAACASYLQAKAVGGHWLLRIEDIDPPREQPGAAELIIDTLAAFGFEWNGPIQYQSARVSRHLELIDRLQHDGYAYTCSCSRSDLARAPRGPLGAIYPGTCRKGSRGHRVAIRAFTDQQPIAFQDGLQGQQSQCLELATGDFIIRRRDGLIAYHLAVVADDHDQGVNEVVRGIDLMDSTPRQILLQRRLGFATPRYLHIPVMVDEAGQKLSKQTGAPALSCKSCGPTLVAALKALAQSPPDELGDANLADIWAWALQHWNVSRLAGKTSLARDDYPLAATRNGLS
jgi:glutamyl-Q tRNA(Asp) synthetase